MWHPFPLFQIELESWDTWGNEDDRPFNPGPGNRPTTGHHRDRLNSKSESESEPDVDYFQDMQPEIRKTAKVSEKTICKTLETINSGSQLSVHCNFLLVLLFFKNSIVKLLVEKSVHIILCNSDMTGYHNFM